MATKSRDISRKRFVGWFAAIGILVPLLLTLVGTLAENKLQWEPRDNLGTTLGIVNWIVWPSWILTIDAEHLAQTAVMLILSASLNGLYYGILGFLLWHICDNRRPQSHAPIPPTSWRVSRADTGGRRQGYAGEALRSLRCEELEYMLREEQRSGRRYAPSFLWQG